MINFAKLGGFRKGIRPVDPESLPRFVDTELNNAQRVIGDLVAAIQNLDERLTALEP